VKEHVDDVVREGWQPMRFPVVVPAARCPAIEYRLEGDVRDRTDAVGDRRAKLAEWPDHPLPGRGSAGPREDRAELTRLARDGFPFVFIGRRGR